MHPIYLDYNATTPIHPVASYAMRPFLRDHFGNPSSSHWFGLQARKAVDEARAQVASLLQCSPDEVIFTSGGSESDNFAIAGYARKHRSRGNHIITSQIEHPAVLEICRVLETEGFEVTCLPVDEAGRVRIDDLRNQLRETTILISIMQANNEVGTIQPIAEIAELAHERNIVVHTDSAQAIGKIPVDVPSLGVDMITIAGHKLYAPKGIGALYVRRGIELQPLIVGAGHERGRRAGTENVLGIVGLGAACALVAREMPNRVPEMQRLRDLLEAELLRRLPQIRINGHSIERLPNTLSASFRGIEANRLVVELGDLVACSPGAACHSDKVSLSHVLEAMKVPVEYAMGTIRFSLGYATTETDIRDAAEAILKVIERLPVP
jgi:cysteine desulfurase NifS